MVERGTNDDKRLSAACTYLSYLGTADMSPKALKEAFYRLACSLNIVSTHQRTYISLDGLGANMRPALKLLTSLLLTPQIDENIYRNMVSDILKTRDDQKMNQQQNFSALRSYALYGTHSPENNVMSETELQQTNPQSLIDLISQLLCTEHTILYYGPEEPRTLLQQIGRNSARTGAANQPIVRDTTYRISPTHTNRVLLSPYSAKNTLMQQVSNLGITYNARIEPLRVLFNAYFGGSIVFQEMRETRGLAYSAQAELQQPENPNDPYVLMAYIATQNDKVADAADAFTQILSHMPASPAAFNLAQQATLQDLRNTRILKEDVLWYYYTNHRMGLTADPRIGLYEAIPKLTLQDLMNFQQHYISNRHYTRFLTGEEKDLDLKRLKKIRSAATHFATGNFWLLTAYTPLLYPDMSPTAHAPNASAPNAHAPNAASALPAKPHFAHLDGLRGVAAVVVVAFHIFEAHATSHADQIINHGYLAVDFFSCSRGLSSATPYDDRWKRLSGREFAMRRLIRLQPMVVLGTLIGALLFYCRCGRGEPACWPDHRHESCCWPHSWDA